VCNLVLTLCLSEHESSTPTAIAIAEPEGGGVNVG